MQDMAGHLKVVAESLQTELDGLISCCPGPECVTNTWFSTLDSPGPECTTNTWFSTLDVTVKSSRVTTGILKYESFIIIQSTFILVAHVRLCVFIVLLHQYINFIYSLEHCRGGTRRTLWT